MKSKKKILLIDDEKDFCFFVKNNLELTKEFIVTYATNPDKGVEIAKRESPDLILLDIIMPKMEGPDVAAVLNSDPKTKQIPIIFLTAVVTQQEIGSGAIKEIGGQNFIAKPVDTETLANCIKIRLGQKKERQ
ncbi:MAG: response regulator [Candidatus Omnitrophota bacterium]|nr:response regulator [Candidatus Omnitrophota bacterium]